MTAILKVFILHLFIMLQTVGAYAKGKGSPGVYDVTEYGAEPSNDDNKDAFMAAWHAACGATAGNATLLIPDGTFTVSTTEFSGPCKNSRSPLVVVVNGILHPCANSDRHRHPGDDDVWITFSGVSNLLITGTGTLDGRGSNQISNAKSKTTTTLELDGVANATVRGLTFLNSRGFHLNIHRSSHVAAEGLHIGAPAASRNTDGVHVGLSSHVTVADSTIGTGDDCVSIGPGCSGVVVSGVVCGPGHGISVGSLGREEGEDDVRGLVVRNCTVMGTTNGLRIKTWPGSPPSRAFNITFRDIVMDNVSNPIIIDQHYCPHSHCSHIAKVVLGVRFDRVNLSCGKEQCDTKFSNVEGKPTVVAEEEASPGAVVSPERARH
uniref:Pectate lyase superfamily protein domain-containing protein n=1 Tax=Leersia perrieri TaxID=77586 RepID=A0A0D9WQR5_9ORYZ